MSSTDLRLMAASDEAAGSEWAETLARGLDGPFSCCGQALQNVLAEALGQDLLLTTANCSLVPWSVTKLTLISIN